MDWGLKQETGRPVPSHKNLGKATEQKTTSTLHSHPGSTQNSPLEPLSRDTASLPMRKD